ENGERSPPEDLDLLLSALCWVWLIMETVLSLASGFENTAPQWLGPPPLSEYRPLAKVGASDTCANSNKRRSKFRCWISCDKGRYHSQTLVEGLGSCPETGFW